MIEDLLSEEERDAIVLGAELAAKANEHYLNKAVAAQLTVAWSAGGGGLGPSENKVWDAYVSFLDKLNRNVDKKALEQK